MILLTNQISLKRGEDGSRENGRDKPKAGTGKMQSLERGSVNYTKKRVKIPLMNGNLHPCARIVPGSS